MQRSAKVCVDSLTGALQVGNRRCGERARRRGGETQPSAPPLQEVGLVRPDRVCLRGATEESVLEYSAPLGVLAPKSFAKSLKTAQLLLFKCGRLARVSSYV